MTDDSLLLSLVENPREATLRGAYADWLQERGEDRRAKFHRDIARKEPSQWDENVLGERLRDLFWLQEQKRGRKLRGCYETFEYRPGVVEWPPRIILVDPVAEATDGSGSETWRRATVDDVRCAWYWEGDGTIIFELARFVLVNYDCKNPRCWRSDVQYGMDFWSKP